MATRNGEHDAWAVLPLRVRQGLLLAEADEGPKDLLLVGSRNDRRCGCQEFVPQARVAQHAIERALILALEQEPEIAKGFGGHGGGLPEFERGSDAGLEKRIIAQSHQQATELRMNRLLGAVQEFGDFKRG